MTACADLQCRNCPKPGKCCSGFGINVPATRRLRHPLEVYAWLASVGHDDPAMGDTGLPFLPLRRMATDDQVAQGCGASWQFWCPRLGRDGRCTDYENRPKLCRLYEAGSDPICALHTPPAPIEVPPMSVQSDTGASFFALPPKPLILDQLRANLRRATLPDGKDWQLTVRQLQILLEIHIAGPKSSGDLSKAIGLVKSTTTRSIQRLEKKGLLSNRRHQAEGQDRRLNVVCMTDAGLTLVLQIAGAPLRQIADVPA